VPAGGLDTGGRAAAAAADDDDTDDDAAVLGASNGNVRACSGLLDGDVLAAPAAVGVAAPAGATAAFLGTSVGAVCGSGNAAAAAAAASVSRFLRRKNIALHKLCRAR